MGCAPSSQNSASDNTTANNNKAEEKKTTADPVNDPPAPANNSVADGKEDTEPAKDEGASPAAVADENPVDANDEAKKNDAAAGGSSARHVERSARTDVGQRQRNKKFKLNGPNEAAFPEADWVREEVLEGCLWKLTHDDEVAYYNDTGDHEVRLVFSYGPDSKIEVLDGGSMTPSTEDEGWNVVEQVVYPSETRRYIKGTPNGMKGSYQPRPISEEFKQKVIDEAAAKVTSELDAVKALGIDGKTTAQVLEMCVASNIKFVDPHFPPCANSLQRPQDEETVPDAPWRRPVDYLNEDEKKLVTLINTAEPDDIDQGALGDCWFLSAIACLAEFPSKIEDIFKHPVGEEAMKVEHRAGGFRITLSKGGTWHEVVVDDYLPCSGAGLPRFSKNVQDRYELWVALLEKAYAKIHGSYSTLVGGDSLFALTDLSGYPTTRFDTEWKDALESREGSNKLFSQMERYDEAGYMLSLGTPGEDTSAYNAGAGTNDENVSSKYKAAGLALGHAYSVLEVKSFPEANVNLCKIRNPWGGATEWSGKWGDDDESWAQHPDIAKACRFEKAVDGTFWMEWEDVKEYFNGGGCCLSKFDWHDYRVKASIANGVSNMILEITVTQDCDAFLIMSQKDQRGNPGHEYLATLLTIAEPTESSATGKGYKAIRHATSDVDSEISEFCFLKAREVAMLHHFKKSDRPYLIMVREHGGAASPTDIGLGLISSLQVGAGLEVAFKPVPAADDCLYYKNHPSFEYQAGVSEAIAAEWQYNPEVGTVQEFKGSCLKH